MTRYKLTLTTTGSDFVVWFKSGIAVHTMVKDGQNTDAYHPVDNLSVGDTICTPQFPNDPLVISEIVSENI
jgi:hypothetical protein